jgi:AcrR family transcriptional regulator
LRLRPSHDTVAYHNENGFGNTLPYHMIGIDMGGEVEGAQKWVAAGLAVLADGGIDRVRVEVVAERLGVTKGGFYRRFKDRRALLDAILEDWSRGRIEAIDRQLELGDTGSRDRLEALIKLYTERVSARGMAIELAIRQWARGDTAAAAAAARVDAHRLAKIEALYSDLGLAVEEAQARAILFYSFIFGQSLLLLQHPPRRRASLIAACTSALLDVGGATMPRPRANERR